MNSRTSLPHSSIFYLVLFSLSIPLYAIEGNEPDPGLELLLPEVKFKTTPEDTLKIPKFKYPAFSIFSQFGQGESGEEYNLILTKNSLNYAISGEGLKVEDRLGINSKIEVRAIKNFSITEFGVKVGRYKVENWQSNSIVELNERLFMGKSILKILASSLYESEFITDYAILLGAKPNQNIFTGAGVSGPHFTPFIQINGYIDNFIFTISHRNKEVTETFDNIYLKYPWVYFNSELKHEYWKSISTIQIELQNIGILELNYKQIGNPVCWSIRNDSISPINYGEENELEVKIELQLGKIGCTGSVKHRENTIPSFHHSIIPLFPELLLNNKLDISLPYDIGIIVENEYNKDRKPLRDYSIFSVMLLKKLGNLRLWCKVNNITDIEYEVIKGVKIDSPYVQGGFELIKI